MVERAIRASIEIQQNIDRWPDVEQREVINVGIGINTGEMVVGNLGSELRTEYSALGDPVNVASGLEALNKEYGTTILISAATRDAVADLVQTRFVARATLKGRAELVEVYELLGLA